MAYSSNQSDYQGHEIVKEDIQIPISIQGALCSEVSIKGGIEQAERLCHDWNSKSARNVQIKCHIHAYSSTKRQVNPSSIDALLNKKTVHPHY